MATVINSANSQRTPTAKMAAIRKGTLGRLVGGGDCIPEHAIKVSPASAVPNKEPRSYPDHDNPKAHDPEWCAVERTKRHSFTNWGRGLDLSSYSANALRSSRQTGHAETSILGLSGPCVPQYRSSLFIGTKANASLGAFQT